MGEGIKINRNELQEMAKTILCEIYSVEKAKSSFDGLDFYDMPNRQGFHFEESKNEGFERRHLVFDDAGRAQGRKGNFTETDEFYPRRNRREFLRQRTQRFIRRQENYRTAQSPALATDSVESESFDNLTQADLPEKLSEVFCRDARRYDGAYERY